MKAKCTGCDAEFDLIKLSSASPCNAGEIVEIKERLTRKQWKQRAKLAEGNEAASELAYKRILAQLSHAKANNALLQQEKWDLIEEITALKSNSDIPYD